MLSLTGHNYIGGERRAAGTVEHKASTPAAVKRCRTLSSRPRRKKSTRPPRLLPPLTRPTAICRLCVVPSSSRPSPTKSTPSVMTSSPWSAAKPHCRLPVSRASVVVQVARCVCSPRCCVVVTSTVHGSTAPCRIASRCRARICVSTRSASVRRRVRCQQLPAGLLHRGWRYRLGSGCRLPGGVQGAQRPHGHCRVRG